MTEINFDRISKKIKQIRLQKGLTQEYIANQANVNTSHISNIENGRVKISLSTLILVCNALEVTLDYILSDEYVHPQNSMEQSILQELRKCNLDTQKRILDIIRILQ